MKDIKIKRHLVMMRIDERGFCDEDFVKQIEFGCKHCLVNKLFNKNTNIGNYRGCTNYQAVKTAKLYMNKYNKAYKVINEI
jgi:hypothetical protein